MSVIIIDIHGEEETIVIQPTPPATKEKPRPVRRKELERRLQEVEPSPPDPFKVLI